MGTEKLDDRPAAKYGSLLEVDTQYTVCVHVCVCVVAMCNVFIWQNYKTNFRTGPEKTSLSDKKTVPTKAPLNMPVSFTLSMETGEHCYPLISALLAQAVISL